MKQGSYWLGVLMLGAALTAQAQMLSARVTGGTVSGVGTMCMLSTSLAALRTSISATPGMTVGVRMVTIR